MSAAESELRRTLNTIANTLPDPRQGLSDPVFEFALKITPMINVDLLVQDAARRVLLAWRRDPYGEGWHVPGGIIRFNEPMHCRISETARLELGAAVEADDQPMHVHQFFSPPRGHFISLVFPCRFTGEPPPATAFWNERAPSPGDLGWFAAAPADLYPTHRAYAELLNSLTN